MIEFVEQDDVQLDAHRLIVSRAMRKYGGSFVASLGAALLFADQQNVIRIRDAFPDYWDKYLGIAAGEEKTDE